MPVNVYDNWAHSLIAKMGQHRKFKKMRNSLQRMSKWLLALAAQQCRELSVPFRSTLCQNTWRLWVQGKHEQHQMNWHNIGLSPSLYHFLLYVCLCARTFQHAIIFPTCLSDIYVGCGRVSRAESHSQEKRTNYHHQTTWRVYFSYHSDKFSFLLD